MTVRPPQNPRPRFDAMLGLLCDTKHPRARGISHGQELRLAVDAAASNRRPSVNLGNAAGGLQSDRAGD